VELKLMPAMLALKAMEVSEAGNDDVVVVHRGRLLPWLFLREFNQIAVRR
jgi:hypothetical protein